jgi:hypothetical protein
MKKIVFLFILVLSISCASQKDGSTSVQPAETYKLSEEYSFKIKKIISDSRCPEGVNCVWAGEVELILSIYKKSNVLEEKTLVFNHETLAENKRFLEKYTSGRKIANIEVAPVKKQGLEITLEEYFLKIKFE